MNSATPEKGQASVGLTINEMNRKQMVDKTSAQEEILEQESSSALWPIK